MSNKGEAMQIDQKQPKDLPWVEKYRPSKLEDIVAQDNIVTSVGNLIGNHKLPHLLFYGPPGTGKTSAALAIAKQLNGAHWNSMTLELNASDDRGIAVVREKIKSFASTGQIYKKGIKFIILDECDAMTNAAQFTLRRVIEKYTKNTRFCIICNYVNKIIPALQSRCTKFRFSPLKDDLIRSKIEEIALKEQVSLSPKGLDAILHLSKGDMRKCLNILQSTFMAYSQVSDENVYLCTGNPSPGDVENVLKSLLNDSFEDAFVSTWIMQKVKGFALSDILSEIQMLVTKLEDLPDSALCFLLKHLADIEYNLSQEGSEKLQTGAFVGTFQIAREQSFQMLQ